MMIFETDEQLKKKLKAISVFVNMFNGSFKKLDPFDVDYKILDEKKNLIAYSEVGIISKTISNAYPLHIQANKVIKLVDKRIPPVIVWHCNDGIIYGKANNLIGTIKWGTIPPQVNDELIIYYDKQSELKYIKFT